jgi:Double-GTPase 2
LTAPEGAEAFESRFFRAPENVWVSAFPANLPKDGDSDGVLKNLAAAHREIEKQQKESSKAWTTANQRMLELREQRALTEGMIGWRMGSKSSSGALSFGLIGLGTVAVLGGLVLLAHENRDRLRWRLRALGSRPSLLILAIVVLPAASRVAWSGPADLPAQKAPKAKSSLGIPALAAQLELERARLEQQLEEKRQANTAAADRLAAKLEEMCHARAAHSLKPETEEQKNLVKVAEALERDVQKSFREIRVLARITSRELELATQTEKELERGQSDLQAFVMGSRGQASLQSLIRIAACVLFILAAVVPLSLVRQRRRRERDLQSRKCPRCLNKDTLDFVTPSTDREFDEGQTMFRLKVCNTCEYEIRENYIHESRLCFPTIGIRSSGKTHWLLMLYDQIKNSNVPVASAIRKIPSRDDQQFDEMVQRLLYAGEHLSPTVYGLPNPLTFHVHDADRTGANKSMVNLFDYSGEMRRFSIDTDEFRRRALLCEGFTLFLDPTQASEGSAGLIASQIDCLSKFAEEMHAIRGLAAEIPIDLPVAICISKIDLLVTKSSMSTQAIPLVTALRQTMTRKVDLSLIHERSQLCAAAMSQMFPGWNVERSLRENFGGRYMYFPMSSVGLEEAELGIEDLSKRLIAPCGMIEPLLWLLHMHGYCVLH